MVVSDHSPCTADLKILDKGDFIQAWGGISSLQFGKVSLVTYLFILYKQGFLSGTSLHYNLVRLCEGHIFLLQFVMGS